MSRKDTYESTPTGSSTSYSAVEAPLSGHSILSKRVSRRLSALTLALVPILPTAQHIEATHSYYQEATQDVEGTIGYISQTLEALNYGTYYFETDQHCSLSDAYLSKKIVNELKPAAVFLGGDLTNSGWRAEGLCAYTLLDGMDETIEKHAVLGNHDTAKHTAKQYKKYGVNVLTVGSLTTMKNGVTLYGATDPTLTQLGHTKTRLRDPSITREIFTDIVTRDIEALGPDIALLHNPWYAKETNPPIIIGGHFHSESHERLEDTIYFIGDDVAAKKVGKSAIWNTHVGTSSRYIFVFDKDDPADIIGFTKISIVNADGKPNVEYAPITYFGSEVQADPDPQVPIGR